MATEPLIRAQNLAMKYRSGQGELVVFTALDFEIQAGQRCAITGPSGSGKSTLLHLLGGLERPTAGAVLFQGRDIFSLSDAALADYRNRHVGYVWQQPSLLPEFTAAENVAFPLLIRGENQSQAQKAARELLAEVGLADRAHHRAGELSGGEQQRATLARALLGGPKLLLADEPTGNLDQQTADAVAELLASLHRSRQLTSIIVTHNLAFAQTCDRVLQLGKGAIAPWVLDSPGWASTSGVGRA